jgi:hypothetical protein
MREAGFERWWTLREKTARPDVLRSRVVRMTVPRMLGPGRRWRLVTELGWALSESGHAGEAGDPAESRIGPPVGESGHRIGPRAEEPVRVLSGGDVDPWAQARQRVREHLRRAVAWRDRMIRDQLTLAQLAEAEGGAPARVTERVGLLRLADTILTDLAAADRRGPIPTQLGEVRRRWPGLLV